LIDTIDFGEDSDPDNLRYDPVTKKIYVGYAEGAIDVIDPVTDKRLPRPLTLTWANLPGPRGAHRGVV